MEKIICKGFQAAEIAASINSERFRAYLFGSPGKCREYLYYKQGSGGFGTLG